MGVQALVAEGHFLIYLKLEPITGRFSRTGNHRIMKQSVCRVETLVMKSNCLTEKEKSSQKQIPHEFRC